MNGSIQQAAAAAGVPYVDISQALIGHRLCEASGNGVAVNGLTDGNDFGLLGINILGRESYHPNALGHQLIEQAILRQTNNLSSGYAGSGAVSPDIGNLLDAPKTGRPINTLVPDSITNRVIVTGESASIKADGAQGGLRPNDTYTVRLDGPAGVVLASLSSDGGGNISGNITVPGYVASGGHTIDITGSGQAGEPVDVTQPVYVIPDGQGTITVAIDKITARAHFGAKENH